MVPVQLRLLTHIAPYEGLGDRPTENPMGSDAHLTGPLRLHLDCSPPVCLRLTWMLLNLFACPCPFAQALLRPYIYMFDRLRCAIGTDAEYSFIPKISPEGVNGQFGSMSRSRVRDTCNMIHRAMGRRGAPIHQPTHQPPPIKQTPTHFTVAEECVAQVLRKSRGFFILVVYSTVPVVLSH